MFIIFGVRLFGKIEIYDARYCLLYNHAVRTLLIVVLVEQLYHALCALLDKLLVYADDETRRIQDIGSLPIGSLPPDVFTKAYAVASSRLIFEHETINGVGYGVSEFFGVAQDRQQYIVNAFFGCANKFATKVYQLLPQLMEAEMFVKTKAVHDSFIDSVLATETILTQHIVATNETLDQWGQVLLEASGEAL